MTIIYEAESRTFHLRAGSISYLMQITDKGYIAHRYFGPSLQSDSLSQPIPMMGRAFSPTPYPEDQGFSADILPQEYPSYGRSDFRIPALEVQFPNGSTVFDLRYQKHTIHSGKPNLPGLPATYVESESEADTLSIELVDDLTGLSVQLSYTAYHDRDVITRSACITNGGKASLSIRRAMSFAIDLPDSDYMLTQLSGAWARERNQVSRNLTQGLQVVESRRGASSHQQNPFIALSRPNATETTGDVLGISLVYSGNFVAGVEVDQYATSRVFAGINPFDFSWQLESGESFQTPEVVLVYSAEGFGHMSRTFHRLFRERLARGRYRDVERPVLINNWEATYFNFNADILMELGNLAAGLGVELFVLDDGWFGHRDSDNSSLGDWIVDTKKLPHGLEDLAHRMNQAGLKFGLWFEPEMVSPDSDLYRNHPDWCLHVPDRSRTEGRNQLVLDYSRPEVCDAVIDMVSNILNSAPIRYVKWDMNRHMTEIGSAGREANRQRETAHRYMLGLYRVLEIITTAFPDVLFESCSGGGGRFDAGMLYYMPQVWTSDNTDAIERLAIQFGTSLAYPPVAMGAHVSAVPNHQLGRVTSIHTRGTVAMMGNLGYELDLRQLSDQDRSAIAEQIAFYKEIRKLVQFGDLYRLLNVQENNCAAWMTLSPDRNEALVSYVRILDTANAPVRYVRLQGIDPTARYEVTLNGPIQPLGTIRDGATWQVGGDELMYHGLLVPRMWGDFIGCTWLLRAISVS